MILFGTSSEKILLRHLLLRDLTSSNDSATSIFAMLKDKEIGAAIEAMRPLIDYWYPAVLEDERALTYGELKSVLIDSGITGTAKGGNPSACFEAALAESRPGDRLVVFGSFYLVGDILHSVLGRGGA